MASEVEHRQRAAPKGGGTGAATTSNRGTINNLLAPPKPSQTPSQPVAKSATGRLWALINGEEDPAPPSPVSGGPQPLFRDDTDETSDEGGSSNAASPVTSPPPYWTNNAPAHAHARSVSNTSVESFLPAGAITLQDNEYDDGPGGSNVYGRDRNRACWAKSVQVTDFVIVNGSATNIGAFVVWNIKVETLNGSYMNICKRYSEFDDLRVGLLQTFPKFKAAMPELPPKSVISKFRPRFLEKRRAGLQYFLNCILLNPEFSGSPVLKAFLFS